MKKAVCLLITTAIICQPVQVVAEEFTNQNKYVTDIGVDQEAEIEGYQNIDFEEALDIEFGSEDEESVKAFDDSALEIFSDGQDDEMVETAESNGNNILSEALYYKGHYYAIFDLHSDWDEAKAYCESLGGYLATIESREENDVVFGYLRNRGYDSAYFGLTDEETEGSWKWVTGEKVDYTNWHLGEPSSANEHYAMFYYKFPDGTWNDGDFGNLTVGKDTTFICEWGTKEDVNDFNISKAKISSIKKVYEYTGKSIKPVPKVILNNKQLVKNKDYKITYKNNKNVGTATIIITGKGKYSGSKKNEFEIAVLKKDIEKSAVSFANIFAEKAQSHEDITIPNAKEQLENLGNQLTITGYSGEVPDEVLEAFATAVLNTIKDSNIDKYETNQNKLANQIYKQIKGGLKSGSKQITLKNGSKYTVNYNIFAQSFGGVGAQVSWADVKWKDTANRSYTVHITANSKNENMKKALASYCAVLAQLNNDIWKDFLTKYVTDGWKLAGLNSIKELDDKTVSKFFDRSERLILVICGDQKAKKEFANDAGKTLKEKLLKMSKTQFQDLIKKNVPDGDKLVKAAGQYKKVIDKYNDYEKKFNKWNKTKKDSDLTKCENAYQKCQDLLDALNDSLNMVS